MVRFGRDSGGRGGSARGSGTRGDRTRGGSTRGGGPRDRRTRGRSTRGGGGLGRGRALDQWMLRGVIRHRTTLRRCTGPDCARSTVPLVGHPLQRRERRPIRRESCARPDSDTSHRPGAGPRPGTSPRPGINHRPGTGGRPGTSHGPRPGRAVEARCLRGTRCRLRTRRRCTLSRRRRGTCLRDPLDGRPVRVTAPRRATGCACSDPVRRAARSRRGGRRGEGHRGVRWIDRGDGRRIHRTRLGTDAAHDRDLGRRRDDARWRGRRRLVGGRRTDRLRARRARAERGSAIRADRPGPRGGPLEWQRRRDRTGRPSRAGRARCRTARTATRCRTALAADRCRTARRATRWRPERARRRPEGADRRRRLARRCPCHGWLDRGR